MADIYANSRSTSGTALRTKDPSPTSGMCPICIKECPVLCEISLSAFRGREVLYPVPEQFGKSTSASNKDYLLDWSHFNILVSMLGAEGIEPNPDVALFENVDIRTSFGGVPLKIPVLTAGLGSTFVAKNNWDALAGGAALAGTIQTVGENVCGVDQESKYSNGKVISSPDLKYRVDAYREFWDGKNGDIIIQTNVEDQRAGVDVYALSKLGVNIIERKWGQGAKAIGGEIRVKDIKRAKELKQRGYIVLPDPDDPEVEDAFKSGSLTSFERHSRVGFPEHKSFVEDVEWLRKQGAKKVFLKTGAYRPAQVAFTMKAASEAKIDALTFDGAGGGTGMSPVPMMNECSTPTVYLQAQVLKCAEILKKKGKHIPDLAMAGGFVNETQIMKSIAMSNIDGKAPLVKAIAMARAPITAAMKSTYFAELEKDGKLPPKFVELYGGKQEQYFAATEHLKKMLGGKFQKLSPGAKGVYSYYYDRLGTGLKQLMAGSRKFALKYLSRDDLCSLSERAAKVTGIPLADEVEEKAMRDILG